MPGRLGGVIFIDRLALLTQPAHFAELDRFCAPATGRIVGAAPSIVRHSAWCHDPAVARRGVQDDNLNFLVIPAPVAIDDFACQLADTFIDTSPSEPRRLGSGSTETGQRYRVHKQQR